MSSLTIINASAEHAGITQSLQDYREGLSSLGCAVSWVQLVDRHTHPPVLPGGRMVPGLGLPIQSIDMGFNRLWWFPRHAPPADTDVVLLADPTLVRMVPKYSRVAVIVHDLRPLTAFSDRFVTSLMFRYAIPRLKHAWRVFVPSAFIYDQLVGRGFDRDQIRIVPETHRLGFHPKHLEDSLRRMQSNREIRVLLVGADRRYKNVDFFLTLAKHMSFCSGYRFSFTIVSQLRPSTRGLVKAMSLRELRVLPHVDDISQVYEWSDVLVFPSLYEGFGRPLIEAMAYGLPILANRIPPVTEIVADSGMLLDPNHLETWSRALSSLEEPATFEEWARRSLDRGRSFVPELFREALRSAVSAPDNATGTSR